MILARFFVWNWYILTKYSPAEYKGLCYSIILHTELKKMLNNFHWQATRVKQQSNLFFNSISASLVWLGCVLLCTQAPPWHIEQNSECTTTPPWRPPLAASGSAVTALMPNISGRQGSAGCVAPLSVQNARRRLFWPPSPSLQSWARTKLRRRGCDYGAPPVPKINI